ncbi:hypothetical protein SKAU_G00314530 [Synaphobranchus kaupii]|uniref:Uncharacterized protein n=1 Tax=Synaphobranchus kaupii TaxID=118154 RepID=A0A9Q1IJH0_SYNKA|nr:hypothetical protein SKAU_G00314530 [Synaphobranchus kaupii]
MPEAKVERAAILEWLPCVLSGGGRPGRGAGRTLAPKPPPRAQDLISSGTPPGRRSPLRASACHRCPSEDTSR